MDDRLVIHTYGVHQREHSDKSLTPVVLRIRSDGVVYASTPDWMDKHAQDQEEEKSQTYEDGREVGNDTSN